MSGKAAPARRPRRLCYAPKSITRVSGFLILPGKPCPVIASKLTTQILAHYAGFVKKSAPWAARSFVPAHLTQRSQKNDKIIKERRLDVTENGKKTVFFIVRKA
ncbi:MAG: hypothetical protein IKX86_06605 [Clostridia bacterium]|nr:hypothetical protein [Clostridia bacterium]